MKAVITGDIINSRKVDSSVWLKTLRELLQGYGNEPENWEIYRGDSFQLITDGMEALEIALIIKSAIRKHKPLDVRMAIGIGEIEYHSKKITESNGTAFINSGEQFQELKKHTLAIKSPNKEFNNIFNIIFQLMMLFANNWTPSTSEIIKLALKDESLSQNQLANKLNKSQSTISAALKRGGYDETMNVINLYKSELKKLC
jgi:GTP cyclohydrolase III